jgi:hypothetical protein
MRIRRGKSYVEPVARARATPARADNATPGSQGGGSSAGVPREPDGALDRLGSPARRDRGSASSRSEGQENFESGGVHPTDADRSQTAKGASRTRSQASRG